MYGLYKTYICETRGYNILLRIYTSEWNRPNNQSDLLSEQTAVTLYFSLVVGVKLTYNLFFFNFKNWNSYSVARRKRKMVDLRSYLCVYFLWLHNMSTVQVRYVLR
jgi:hypothetical protein